ncbi:hypothetical protein Bca101_057708 [Brassica carinata]
MKLNPAKCSFGKCESALHELKAYFTTPLLLSKPLTCEVLLLYLAVSEHAVSAILVREEESKQLPIYYVSKSLLDAETRCSHLEKLALALMVVARKLRPYIQAHPVVVVSSFPIKLVLHKPEVLADFVAEFSPTLLPAVEQEVRLQCNTTEEEEWTFYVDGSSNIRGAGVGIVLTSPTGNTALRAGRCNFKATNNESEYEALIAGLTLAHQMGAENIHDFSNSQLIINSMIQYRAFAQRLLRKFRSYKLTQFPREQNSQDDALANLGSALETKSQMRIPC